MNIAVVTTFPNNCWNIYAKAMLESFVSLWPKEIPLLVQIDDNVLDEQVRRIIRPQDGLVCGWTKEHTEFVERNRSKDDPQNYRKQAVRFCHKVFALKFALDAAMEARAANTGDAPRYLIWMDADVITTSFVIFDDIAKCLPKEGDAVAYLGRKDWDHSECGWLAFDLDNDGEKIINGLYALYDVARDGENGLFKLEQWHDSYLFDVVRNSIDCKSTNLTTDKPGRDIWQHSPMAKFSDHHKGPVAKGIPTKKERGVPLTIQTKNSIPDESIKMNIAENQKLIKNWVVDCLPNEEEIVVVSAGPSFIAEELAEEVAAGRRIVAVKHALEPLEQAGIKPWACILLDPRPHVSEFVKMPDKDVIWFVASQVVPEAVKSLLDAGCTVWGYHAAVGANESDLTDLQPSSVVQGGSATATRGLFLLDKLGFRKFRLYGYDLCFPDKPDMGERDKEGQPKYFDVSIKAERSHYKAQKNFWTQGELIAQYQEIVDIITKQKWDIQAFGDGIVPFLIKGDRVNNLRAKAKKDKLNLPRPALYEDMLCLSKKKNFSAKLHSILRKTRRKLTKASSF